MYNASQLKLDNNEIPVIEQQEYIGITFDKNIVMHSTIQVFEEKIQQNKSATQSNNIYDLKSGQKSLMINNKIQIRSHMFYVRVIKKIVLERTRNLTLSRL